MVRPEASHTRARQHIPEDPWTSFCGRLRFVNFPSESDSTNPPDPGGRADWAPDSKAILELLPDSVLTTDRKGTILTANAGTTSIFGYSADQLMGSQVDKLLSPGASFEPNIERAISERRAIIGAELRGRRKDGREFDLEISISPVADRDGVIITARDISQWKRTERRSAAAYAVTRALSDAKTPEEALRRVLAGMCVELGWVYGALWTPNAEGTEIFCTTAWFAPDRSLEEFDAANRRIRLRKGKGLPGRVWLDLQPAWITDIERDRNFTRALHTLAADLNSAAAVPIIVGTEVFGVMELFSRMPLVQDDAVVRTLMGIGSEVGQYILRIRAEEELRSSEQRFRTLAETASDAIITMDDRSRITFANPAVNKIFGYTPEELAGRRMTLLMPKRFRAAHRIGVKRYITTGRKNIPWSRVELVGLHRDGHEVPIEVSFGEFVVGQDHIFTGMIRDISDRHLQREAINQVTAALQARLTAPDL